MVPSVYNCNFIKFPWSLYRLVHDYLINCVAYNFVLSQQRNFCEDSTEWWTESLYMLGSLKVQKEKRFVLPYLVDFVQERARNFCFYCPFVYLLLSDDEGLLAGIACWYLEHFLHSSLFMIPAGIKGADSIVFEEVCFLICILIVLLIIHYLDLKLLIHKSFFWCQL